MALTVRTNGSGGSNIIQASWFNDFLNLLEGSMSDQPVTINNTVSLKQITYTTPTSPTLALNSGTGMSVGLYSYAVTFVEGNGETIPGTAANITTTTGNTVVALTAIPTGPTGTTARRIYRSKVGTTTPLFLVTTLSNNTATTYTDSTADASLGAQAPSHDSFGGSLLIYNQSGTLVAQIYADGSIWLNNIQEIASGTNNYLLVDEIDSHTGKNLNIIMPTGALAAFGFGGHGTGTYSTQISSTGIRLLSGGITGVSGDQLSRLGNSSGTGSGTFNHSVGAVPDFAAVTTHVAGSTQSVGYDSETSTQFHVDTGASLAWFAFLSKRT